MPIPVRTQQFYAFRGGVSIVIGACMIVGGVVLIVTALANSQQRTMLLAVGSALAIIGVMRLANGIYVLRQMRRRKNTGS